MKAEQIPVGSIERARDVALDFGARFPHWPAYGGAVYPIEPNGMFGECLGTMSPNGDWMPATERSCASGAAMDLPESPWRYFNQPEGTFLVPVAALKPVRARPKGLANAGHFMRLAYDGAMERRQPISVEQLDSDTWRVLDGNSTYANAVASGWMYLPALEVAPKSQREHNPKKEARPDHWPEERKLALAAGWEVHEEVVGDLDPDFLFTDVFVDDEDAIAGVLLQTRWGTDIILTRSARDPGYWQASRLDKDGEPWGHSLHGTLEEALKEERRSAHIVKIVKRGEERSANPQLATSE